MDTFIFLSFVVILLCGAVLVACGAMLMQRADEQRRSTAVKQQRLMRRWSDKLES